MPDIPQEQEFPPEAECPECGAVFLPAGNVPEGASERCEACRSLLREVAEAYQSSESGLTLQEMEQLPDPSEFG